MSKHTPTPTRKPRGPVAAYNDASAELDNTIKTYLSGEITESEFRARVVVIRRRLWRQLGLRYRELTKRRHGVH
jgi:hypothetical protein